MEEEALLKKVLALGLAENRAKEIVKKEKLYAPLLEVAAEAGITQCEKKQGALLQTLAASFPKGASRASRALLARSVAAGEIDTADRLAMALALAEEAGVQSCVDHSALAQRCKFGFQYTDQSVAALLTSFLDGEKELAWDSKLFEQAKKTIPGCDGRMAKQVYDELLTKRIGEAPKKEKKKGGGAGKKDKPAQNAKPKKAKPVVEKLAPIRVNDSNMQLAQEVLRIASQEGLSEDHKLGMISDTLAALRADSYSKGLAGGGSMGLGAVRLPTRNA